MDNPLFFKEYAAHLSFQPDRYGKSTLFENENILVGLNCLQAGQSFDKHAHEVQTRFYVVLEGKGLVWIGDEKQETAPGSIIWVPPGYTHKIENIGQSQMILLVGIAPAHAD
jgi:quercetin dioxygenase-like cupin family protein